PDYRVGHGLAAAAVPQHCGLALVGDSKCSQVADLKFALLQRVIDDFACALPDLSRVMLHPARLRIDLRVLALCTSHDLARTIENNQAGAGGALIEGGNIVRHFREPLYRIGLPLTCSRSSIADIKQKASIHRGETCPGMANGGGDLLRI